MTDFLDDSENTVCRAWFCPAGELKHSMCFYKRNLTFILKCWQIRTWIETRLWPLAFDWLWCYSNRVKIMAYARIVIIEKIGELIRLDVHQESITTGFYVHLSRWSASHWIELISQNHFTEWRAALKVLLSQTAKALNKRKLQRSLPLLK